jgi:hypothetical protein
MEFSLWLEQDDAWKGVKGEVIRFWKALEERPIYPKPIPNSHKGSSYNQDAIRITGTANFINAIMSRLKDFLQFQTPNIELDVDYRQIVDKFEHPVSGKYVCYIRLREKVHHIKKPRKTSYPWKPHF